MMAKSHVIIGVAAWVAAAPLLHLPSLDPVYLGLAVTGSLLPDIDHPQSWVGRRTRPLSSAIAAVLGHRGLTHSAVALVGLVILLLHTGNRSGAVSALAVGYLSHMAADMLTPRGLRLAWPLKQTWGLPLCRSGSPMETLIVLAVVGGVAWYLLHPHRPVPHPPLHARAGALRVADHRCDTGRRSSGDAGYACLSSRPACRPGPGKPCPGGARPGAGHAAG